MTDYCGLINNGNYCYFISIIQNLRFSKSIIKNLCDETEHKKDLELLKLIKNVDKETLEKNQLFFKKAILYLNFKKLIISMCSNKDKEAIPIDDFLKSCYRVSMDTNKEELFSGNQNCSGEFILFLLDILHSTKKIQNFKLTFNSLLECKSEKDVITYNCEQSLKTHFKNEYSWILDEFNITMCTTCCCNNCGYSSMSYEPDFIFILNIPEEIENCNIEDCLDYYTKKESCEWTCEKCDNKDSNYKECKLYNTPQTLIIHLSRFRYDHFTNSSDKIKSKISYNEFLNIKNYKLFNEEQNNIYELYGVLCHIGNINYGHYYTYCKDEKKFYLFNDENVSIKDEFPIETNAYILFYKLIN